VPVETFTPAGVMTPIGPSSHIARAGPILFISATAGVDPATGELAGPDTYSQARQILRSLRAMLESVGATMEQVVHVHVFMVNMDDFEDMNRAYRDAFGAHRPARSVIGVSALPQPGALLTMNLNAFSGPAAT
jgi:2-iminobutanoate/2-iminopropanoate deaminase